MLLPLLGLIFSALILWSYVSRNNSRNRPPGPFPLPLVGNLHQIAWRSFLLGEKQAPFRAMQTINEMYGPLASFQYGLLYNVVTDDYEVMKEILCSDAWAGRHWDSWFGERSWGIPYGILFSTGDEWKEMRRFILRTLRDFGFGKHKSQEGVMIEELDELMTRLNHKIDTEGSIIPMKQFFTISVLNVLWSMITGTRFSHDDVKLKRFNQMGSQLIQTTPIGGNLANAFPWLTHYYARETRPLFKELHQYFRDLLEEKRSRQDYQEDQRDFVEVFLKEIDNHKGRVPNFYTDDQFVIVIFDLFMAGSETTSNTLEFAILYMILNPQIQDRIQMEIDTVIGSSRFPAAADKQNMPFTEATLLEVQRFANVLPLDSRSAMEDTKLLGYDIKKGTPAMLNLYSLHFSKKIWSDPQVFNPSRFLDTDNNIINAHKIMPFGAGKRACIGESMARLTLFAYFATLLQRYKFTTVSGSPVPSAEPVLGFTLCPQTYSVQISQR